MSNLNCHNCGKPITWHHVGRTYTHVDGPTWCYPHLSGYDQPRATPVCEMTPASRANPGPCGRPARFDVDGPMGRLVCGLHRQRAVNESGSKYDLSVRI